MFFIYQFFLTILIFISPIIIIIRILKNKEDKQRFIEKFSTPTKKRANGKLLWIHGASVGEILSVIPIIKNYEKNNLIKQILITSSTLSSSKIIKKFKFRKTIHQFYPIDHSFFVNKFLNYWRPSMAIFLESEIWPCMFNNLDKKKIPLILLNARITKKTFNRWYKIKTFSKKIFGKITKAFPQNVETKFYLKKYGINQVYHLGNLKFAEDNLKDYEKIDKNLKLQFDKKKIWVASSTHKSEEIFCAKTHLLLKKKIKNLLTIIIPRHVHRVDEIIKEVENLNLKTALHSEKKRNINEIDIYIVDTFGETKKFHEIGCSVFLGGSILKRGGQNPLEAARFGAKILHGPNIDNFKDVYKLLKLLKISKKINTPIGLASEIAFTKDKNMGQKIKNIGEKILKKIIKELDKLINNEFKKT